MDFKKFYLVIGLIFLVLLAGCVFSGNNPEPTPTGKTVQVGDRVHVTYIGYTIDDNGIIRQFDATPLEHPAEFLIGKGELIPGVDQAILGMKEGEFKKITVSPELGYGPSDPRLFAQEGILLLQNAGYNVRIGEKIKTSTGSGVISAIDENAGFATVNFNHPLAGKILHFELTVVKVIK